MMTRKRAAIGSVLVTLGLVVGVVGAATVAADHGGPHAECTNEPRVQQVPEQGTSIIEIQCNIPYPPQDTVTEPGPTHTTTVPGPTVTETYTEFVTVEPSPTDPTTTEPPAEPQTMWGASIAGTSNTGQGVVNKYNHPRVYVRQFFGSGADSTPPLSWPEPPAGVLMHRSYKPSTSITDAQIDALLMQAEGHWVTFWHESDNDGLTGTALTARINLQNRLYDRNVALGRPALVVPTFTGGMFASYTGETYKQTWNTVKGDLLGIDLDGVDNCAQTYTSEYDDEIAEGMDWLEDNPEYTGWAAPEFGTCRHSSDPSGNARLAWMQEQVGFMDAAPVQPAGVAWYDYNSTTGNSIEPGQPEYNYWRSLIVTN